MTLILLPIDSGRNRAPCPATPMGWSKPSLPPAASPGAMLRTDQPRRRVGVGYGWQLNAANLY